MQATPSLDFIPPKPKELNGFANMLQKSWRNLTTLINNKIGFGDGTNHDNIDGVWANIVAPVAPNTDFTITHNLGRVPVGYWVMQKDRACDVYTGSVAATSLQITLRATVASAVLRLFILSLILALFGVASFAQTTSLTLQVTDAGGQTWNNGTWSAVLSTPPGVSPPGPPFNGIGTTTPVPNQNQSGTLSATGSATMTLTQNSGIVPALSQWKFVVCPQATAPCFSQFATITATATLTLVPPAISVNCGLGVNAYLDSEVSCGVGGHYYNLTNSVDRVCTTVVANACSAWTNAGGTSSSTQFGANTALTGAIIESFGLGFATPSQASQTVTIAANQASPILAGVTTLSGIGGAVYTPCATLQKAETTTADANVLTCAPAAAIGTYRLSVSISVSAATSGVIGWTATWTDSNGNAQTPVELELFQNATALPALTFTTSAAGNYHGSALIDVNNAGTNIVIKWIGGGTTTAKMSAMVERIL